MWHLVAFTLAFTEHVTLLVQLLQLKWHDGFIQYNTTVAFYYMANHHLLFKTFSLFFLLQEVHKSNIFTPHKTKNHITNFIISCGYESCNSQMRTSAQFLFCTDTCLHGSCNMLYW